MDIKNIKPVKLIRPIDDSRKFRPRPLKASEYKEKPNAFKIRQLLIDYNISQREAARLAGVPWNRFQSWIMPCRHSDAPLYALENLKSELNNDC